LNNQLTKSIKFTAFLIAILSVFACAVLAQSVPGKKNSRPAESKPAETAKVEEFTPVYSYTFSNPKFFVSDIRIDHDEKGVGKVVFRKRDYEEDVEEPLVLSDRTLEKLKGLWDSIGFLSSNEDYQSPERDYGQLGTMRIGMSLSGRSRTAEFNWTENKQVKELTDEYKKIGNQAIWIFDINVARQNQPLETPRIMKALDSYLRRGGISDPSQMLPFLTKLKEDERIPLIARNHAERLISAIEKSARQ